MFKNVEDVKEGDILDLEGDSIADPGSTHPLLRNDWQVVVSTERETPECVTIYFPDFTCAFPAGHLVQLKEETL